ncbi:MAG TPA: anion transporter [Synergistaceae bacterium]|nr:anion transporter [Synergistaceae bacterium]
MISSHRLPGSSKSEGEKASPFPKRFIVIGKGGTGKTTISAAMARALSSRGSRTLVVSLDPAHNLGDVLGSPLAAEPKEVKEGLSALEVDLDSQVQAYVRKKLSQMRPIYGHLQIFNADHFLEALEQSPGMEEFAMLEAVGEIRERSPAYDAVILDTAPTGMTLRMLSLPAVTLLWIDNLLSLRLKILERRAYIQRVERSDKLRTEDLSGDDPVVQELRRYRGEIIEIQSFLRDTDAAVLLMLQADKLSVTEADRAIEKLSNGGFTVGTCIINRTTEGKGRITRYAVSGLDEFIRRRGGIRWIELPDMRGEISTPQGLDALGNMIIDALSAQQGGHR